MTIPSYLFKKWYILSYIIQYILSRFNTVGWGRSCSVPGQSWLNSYDPIGLPDLTILSINHCLGLHYIMCPSLHKTVKGCFEGNYPHHWFALLVLVTDRIVREPERCFELFPPPPTLYFLISNLDEANLIFHFPN